MWLAGLSSFIIGVRILVLIEWSYMFPHPTMTMLITEPVTNHIPISLNHMFLLVSVLESISNYKPLTYR